MHCVECGVALVDNVKFCPFCGTKVAPISDMKKTGNVAITPPNVPGVHAVSINLLKQTLALEPNRVVYNSFRLKFKEYADSALAKFADGYRTYRSLEDVIKQAPGHAYAAMQPILTHCVNEMISHGVYTIDADTFLLNMFYR